VCDLIDCLLERYVAKNVTLKIN